MLCCVILHPSYPSARYARLVPALTSVATCFLLGPNNSLKPRRLPLVGTRRGLSLALPSTGATAALRSRRTGGGMVAWLIDLVPFGRPAEQLAGQGTGLSGSRICEHSRDTGGHVITTRAPFSSGSRLSRSWRAMWRQMVRADPTEPRGEL